MQRKQQVTASEASLQNGEVLRGGSGKQRKNREKERGKEKHVHLLNTGKHAGLWRYVNAEQYAADVVMLQEIHVMRRNGFPYKDDESNRL